MRTLRKFDVGGAREAGSDLVQTTPAQRRRNSGQRGSTLVEYALIIALMCFAAVVAMQTIATDLNNAFSGISKILGTYVP